MTIVNQNTGEQQDGGEEDKVPICGSSSTLKIENISDAEKAVNILPTSNSLSLQTCDYVKCIDCDEKVPENKIIELIKHIRNEHGKDSVIKFRIRETKYLPLRCDECEYCFATKEIFDKHINESHGDSKKYTKCEWYAKTVYKMRKRDRKLRKKKSKTRRLKMFEEIAKSTFCCPLIGCNEIVDQVTDIVNHVEQHHSPKEFIVFMTSDDFFDFLGQRCKTCNFLYQRTEVHSSAICRKYQELRVLHPMSSVEVHRLLNHMIDDNIIGDTSSSNSSAEGSRRRKRRKREVDMSKTSPDSNGNDESDDSDGNVDVLPIIKESRVSTSLYHRCPVLDCAYKTLRPDNPEEFNDIKYHMRLYHNSCHNLFCQTKLSSSEIVCRGCNFWFLNKHEFNDHLSYGCFSFFPLEHLNELFDMTIMQEDYKYDYFGANPVNETLKPNDQNGTFSTNWLECPIEKCSKLDKKDLAVENGLEIMEKHIYAEHREAICKIRTSLYENLTAPIRCGKCNWFCFTENEMQKHGSKKTCQAIIETAEKMKLDGTWVMIKFKKKFALKKKQDIDDIIQLKNNSISPTCPTKCMGCGSIFANSKILEQHLQKDHNKRIWIAQMRMITKQKSVVCTKCTFAFDNVSYQNHVCSRHCEFNERMVKNVENLCKNFAEALPIKVNVVGPRLRQLTEEQFSSAANSEEYRMMKDQVKENLSYSCHDCDRSYREIKNLHGHYKRYHGLEAWLKFRLRVIPGIQEYVCPKCLFVFQKKVNHECKRNKQLSDECLIEENAEIEVMWPCPKCNQKFSFSNDGLYQHIFKSHGVSAWVQFRSQPIDDMQEHVCEGCGFFFRKMYSHDCNEYRQHLSNHENKNDPLLHPCPECDEMCTFSLGKIYSHLRFKHGVVSWLRFRCRRIPIFQEHQCMICQTWGKKVMSRHNHANCEHLKTLVEKHRLEILKTDTKYRHKQCDEGTPLDKRNLPCPCCEKLLNAENNDLYKHISEKHGIKEWTIFRTKRMEGIQEHECKKCKFYFNIDVYFHDCEYQQKCYLRYIDNIMNSDDISSSNENSVSDETYIIDERPSNSTVSTPALSSIVTVSCPKCSQTTSLKALYRHILASHGVRMWLEFRRSIIPGVQEYKCDKCLFVFCSSNQTSHRCREYRKYLDTYGSDLDVKPKVVKDEDVENDADDDAADYSEDTEESAADDAENDEEYKAEYEAQGSTAVVEPPDTAVSSTNLVAKCPHCDRSLALTNLYRHIEHSHGREHYLTYRRRIIPGLKEHKCNGCKFVFHKPNHGHHCYVYKRYKVEDPNLKCEFCSYVGANRNTFYAHLRKTHTRKCWLEFRARIIPGWQDVRCPKCKFCFMRLQGHHCNAYLRMAAEMDGVGNGEEDTSSLEHLDGVIDETSLLESLTYAQFACPDCGEDQQTCTTLYAHTLQCLSPSEWLQFRTTCQPGIHEHKCPNVCAFYLRKPGEDHDCKKFAEKADQIRNTRNRRSNSSSIQKQTTSKEESSVYVTCPICDRAQSSRSNFTSHMYRYHTEYEKLKVRSMIIPGWQESRCTKCFLYFFNGKAAHKCSLYIEQLQSYPDIARKQLLEFVDDPPPLDAPHSALDNGNTDDIRPLACPICPKRVKNRKAFYSHLKIQHTEREVYAIRTKPLPGIAERLCTKCGFYFFTGRSHKCTAYQELGRRVRESIDADTSLSNSDKILPPLSPLSPDSNSQETLKFTCPECGKVDTREEMYIHIRNHSREAWFKFRTTECPGQEYRCNECSFVFFKPNVNHDCEFYSVIAKELYSSLPDPVPNQVSRIVDVPPANGLFKCPLCPSTYKQRKKFFTHLSHSHRSDWLRLRTNPIPGISEYLCKRCGFYRATPTAAHRCGYNIAKAKAIDENYPYGCSPVNKKGSKNSLHTCPHCGKKCSLDALEDHIKEAHGEKSWANFKSKQTRDPKHDPELSPETNPSIGRKRTQALMNSTKSDIYKCPECNSQCNSNQDLITHLDEKHSKQAWLKYRTSIIPGVQEHPCIKCKFVFTTPDEKHSCDEYRHTFDTPVHQPRDSSLDSLDHLSSVDANILHTCPNCGKQLKAKSFYNHLIYRHSREVWIDYRTAIIPGIQEHRCGKCKIVFSKSTPSHNCQRYQYYTHDVVIRDIPVQQVQNNSSMVEIEEPIASKIEGVTNTEPNSANSIPLSPLGEQKKLHICPECEKIFSTNSIYQHLKKAHTIEVWYKYRTSIIPGLQEYRCKKCNFVLKSSSSHHDCAHYSSVYKHRMPSTLPKPVKEEVNEINMTPTIPEIPDEKRVACEFCGRPKPALRLFKHILRCHGFEKWYIARRTYRHAVFEYKCHSCCFFFEDQTKAQSGNHQCELFSNKSELMVAVQREQQFFDSDLPVLMGLSSNASYENQLIGVESNKSRNTKRNRESSNRILPELSVLDKIPAVNTVVVYKTPKVTNKTLGVAGLRKRRLSSASPCASMENTPKKQRGLNGVHETDSYVNSFAHSTPIGAEHVKIYKSASGVVDDIDSPLSSPRVLDCNIESDCDDIPGNRSDTSQSRFTDDSKTLRLGIRSPAHNSSETDSKDSISVGLDEPNTTLQILFNSKHQSDFFEPEVPENVPCGNPQDYIVVDEYQDTNDDIELNNEFDGSSGTNIHAINNSLHQRAAENGRFQCLIKDCAFVDTFKRMNTHMRAEHSESYLMYRYCMLSKYGIMEKQCEDCSFQFVTQSSYEHHKDKDRCSTYKELKFPSEPRQIEIIKSMKTHLISMD